MVLPAPTAGDLKIKWESMSKNMMNSKALASHKSVTYKKISSRAEGGSVTQASGRYKPHTSWVSVQARRMQGRAGKGWDPIQVGPVLKWAWGYHLPWPSPRDHCHNCTLRPSTGQTAHLSFSYPIWNYDSKGEVGFQRISWRFRLDSQNRAVWIYLYIFAYPTAGAIFSIQTLKNRDRKGEVEAKRREVQFSEQYLYKCLRILLVRRADYTGTEVKDTWEAQGTLSVIASTVRSAEENVNIGTWKDFIN